MNNDIINNFNLLLQLLKQSNKYELNKKIKKTNMFRIRQLSYSKDIISNLDYKITIDNVNKLLLLPGIGKGTVARICEILNTNTLDEINYLQNNINNQYTNLKLINDLSTIIGIGDKIALKLIQKYNITSLSDFKNKVNNNEINIPDKIKLAMKYLDVYQQNIPREEINLISDYLNQIIYELDSKYIFIICGSYRRMKQTSNDIDILLIHEDFIIMDDNQNNHYLSNIIKKLHDTEFIIDDLTNSNKTKYMGFCQLNKKFPIRRIDIRMMPVESFFPALLYFTGSYEFNQMIRKTAKKKGYKLNEYGLFEVNTNKKIILINEKMIFNILGMEYLSPEKRN